MKLSSTIPLKVNTSSYQPIQCSPLSYGIRKHSLYPCLYIPVCLICMYIPLCIWHLHYKVNRQPWKLSPQKGQWLQKCFGLQMKGWGEKSKETAVKIFLKLPYCKTTVTSFVWCGFRPLLPSTGILTTKAKLKLCCNSLKDSAVCRGEANFQIQMHQRSFYLELKTDKRVYMNQLPRYLGF